jgi:hypothetical protein
MMRSGHQGQAVTYLLVPKIVEIIPLVRKLGDIGLKCLAETAGPGCQVLPAVFSVTVGRVKYVPYSKMITLPAGLGCKKNCYGGSGSGRQPVNTCRKSYLRVKKLDIGTGTSCQTISHDSHDFASLYGRSGLNHTPEKAVGLDNPERARFAPQIEIVFCYDLFLIMHQGVYLHRQILEMGQGNLPISNMCREKYQAFTLLYES